jgi:hypothetical protein
MNEGNSIQVIVSDPYFDDTFQKIQSTIENKKKYLLSKQKKIHEMKSQNKFLESVYQDYCKFNSYYIQQEYDKIKSLQLLNKYIETMKEKNKRKTIEYQKTKQDQIRIMKEINSIQLNLKNITQFFPEK